MNNPITANSSNYNCSFDTQATDFGTPETQRKTKATVQDQRKDCLLKWIDHSSPHMF